MTTNWYPFWLVSADGSSSRFSRQEFEIQRKLDRQFCNTKLEIMSSVPDPWFPIGVVASTPIFGAKTYYLGGFLPKTAWKWKKLDRKEGAGWGSHTYHPLDPPTVCMKLFVPIHLKICRTIHEFIKIDISIVLHKKCNKQTTEQIDT